MTILISNNGEFNNGLKFEARGSGHGLSHGPVYGSAGYLALRLDNQNLNDTNIYLHKSTDGVNWTETSSGITMPFASINKLTYLNGMYFVIGSDGSTTYISYSTNGTTWTNWSGQSIGGTIYEINYVNGFYVILLQTGDVYRSSDLSTWSLRSSGPTLTGYSGYVVKSSAVAGANMVVVAEALQTSNSRYVIHYHYSTNSGSTWTNATIVSGTSKRPTDIATDGTNWVIVGLGGIVYTSPNITTWTLQTSGTSVDLLSITYANSLWVAYSNDSVITTILTSTNRTTWTARSTPLIETNNILYRANGVWASSTTRAIYANSKWHVGNYTSTDAATWTIYDYQVPNQQPFLRYDYQPGWTTWKTLDFWFYVDSQPADFTIFGLISITPTAGQAVANTFDTSFRSDSSAFNYGAWNHYRFLDDGSHYARYINGTRVAYGTSTSNTSWRTNTGPLIVGSSSSAAESQYARPVDYYIDEVMLTDELINVTTDTTITVPTAPWRNNDYTSILLHFDTDFNDDPSTPIRNGSATVPAIFTQVTNANKTVKTPAALTTTASLNTSVTKAVNTSSTLDTTAAITANLGIIKRFSSNLTVDASELTVDVRTRGFGAVLTTSASLNSIPTKQFGVFTAALTSTSGLSANLVRVKQFSVSLETIGSTLIADTRTRGDSASLSATAVLTSSAVRNRTVAVALSTTATQTATIGSIKQFGASLVVGASKLTVDQKTSRTSATLTTTATLSTTATRRRNGTATISCQANIVVNASQSRIIRASLSTTSILFASTRNVKRATANLVVGAFEVSTGRVINLDYSDTWIIPADTRVWIIQNDNRLWTIADEDRTYTIKG